MDPKLASQRGKKNNLLNAIWVELVSAHIFKVRKSKSLSKIYKKGEVEELMDKRPVAVASLQAWPLKLHGKGGEIHI